MNMPLPLANKRPEEKMKPSAIESTIHDIINQLSVISLCCCELDNSVAEKLEADQLKEFKKIETSVQETAAMIRRLKAILKDQGYTGNARKWESASLQAKVENNFHAVPPRFVSRR